MTKQYAFYRDPAGKPAKRDDLKQAPSTLLKEYGNASVLNDQGGVSWTGFDVMVHEDAVVSSFVFLDAEGQEINESDSRTLVWKALGETAKLNIGKPIDSKKILEIADGVVASYLRQPEVSYILQTSLSVEQLPARKFQLLGAVIKPISTKSKFALPNVLSRSHHRAPFAKHLDTTKYQPVHIAITGRTVHDAVEKALGALSLLRALWSLAGNYRRRSLFYAGHMRTPLAIIHTGPLHTLHYPDGSLVNKDIYFYEPDYREDQELFKRTDRWEPIEDFRKKALNAITKVPYSTELLDLLNRYVGALDQTNHGIAFLQMWAILEKITNTVGAKYDDTIARATWVYHSEDRPMTREVLNSLRHLRNRYVHSGKGKESREIVFMIKWFIDPHLIRLIHNSFRVRSLQEYAEVLSLPSDQATLKRRHQKLSMVLRWSKLEAEQD